MIRRCRFCGEKIATDASQCEHCGKVLKIDKEATEEGARLTNLESWKGKSVPAWVMYAVVGFAVVVAAIMAIDGCNRMSGGENPLVPAQPE